MKLEILIPQYKETEEVIRPLLDSIAIQQNIDFQDIGVIICNDGSEIKLSEKFLNSYGFNITYLINEHKGVSAARNVCLNHATADYVMFCDADDMFYNSCAFYILFKEMEKQFDSLTSVFVEETRNPQTKEIVYINRETDVTFVHGKAHRRKFLIDNNICWNEKLTVHEDSYFNVLCKTMAREFRYVTSSFYLWRWRDTSVCRHDEKYMFKTYNNLIDSNSALILELINRGYHREAQMYVTSMIFDTYYMLNKTEWWDDENIEYRRSVERRFKKYFIRFKNLYESISDNDKNFIIMNIKNRMYGEGLVLEKITFDDWLDSINGMQKDIN